MKYHLAQLNIATMRYPVDSPEMAEFVAQIDAVNAVAERSPGFVWRLVDDLAGNALSIRIFDDMTLVNMSVWESVEALRAYVYAGDHLAVLRRHKEWFDRMDQAHMVLWWIAEGEVPTLVQAKEKLMLLRTQGPGAEAFGFKSVYPPPGKGHQNP